MSGRDIRFPFLTHACLGVTPLTHETIMKLKATLLILLAACTLSACGNNENNGGNNDNNAGNNSTNNGTNNSTNNGSNNGSNNGDNNGDGETYKSFGEAYDALVDAQVSPLCESAFECPQLSSSFVVSFAGRYGSVDACKEALKEVFFEGGEREQLEDAIADGRSTFDLSLANRCIPRAKAYFDSNKCTPNARPVFEDDDDECNTLLTGNVTEGGACVISEECSGNLECTPSGDDVCVQTCVAPKCGEETCSEDQYCDTFAQQPTCVTYAKAGESCANASCDNDSSCVFPGQTCVANYSVPEGGACDFTSSCVEGAVCTEQVCTKPSDDNSRYAKDGEACSVRGCLPGLSCKDVDESTQQGTCGPLSKLAEACAFSFDCVGGLFCDETSNECAQPKANGATCSDDDQCQSSNCEFTDDDFTNGTCASEPAVCSL